MDKHLVKEAKVAKTRATKTKVLAKGKDLELQSQMIVKFLLTTNNCAKSGRLENAPRSQGRKTVRDWLALVLEKAVTQTASGQ